MSAPMNPQLEAKLGKIQKIGLFLGVLGLVGAGGGVALSYPLNLPSGPCITLTLAGLFVLSLVGGRLRRSPTASP